MTEEKFASCDDSAKQKAAKVSIDLLSNALISIFFTGESSNLEMQT